MSALIAFEATARLESVTNAAAELNTTQPAISRHIRNVESVLGRILLRRQGKGMTLTKEGEIYYESVRSSLATLHTTACEVRSQHPEITIACTQEVAALLLLPVALRLKRSVNDGVKLRIVNCDYDSLSLIVPTGVDIIFGYDTASRNPNAIRMLDEQVVPVASPGFVKQHAQVFSGNPCNWTGFLRLELACRDEKWADWATWFSAHECEPPPGPVDEFENYLFMLEAAANGHGVALGWNGFVNGYLHRGQLVPIGSRWHTTGIGMYATLTPRGNKNPYARHCINSLASLAREMVLGDPQ